VQPPRSAGAAGARGRVPEVDRAERPARQAAGLRPIERARLDSHAELSRPRPGWSCPSWSRSRPKRGQAALSDFDLNLSLKRTAVDAKDAGKARDAGKPAVKDAAKRDKPHGIQLQCPVRRIQAPPIGRIRAPGNVAPKLLVPSPSWRGSRRRRSSPIRSRRSTS